MKAAVTITKSELIGLDTKITKSTNRDSIGISGKVINETRNTLVVRQNNSGKVVPKETTVFRFTLPNGSVVEVEGNAIIGRPEDRVKKKPRRQW